MTEITWHRTGGRTHVVTVWEPDRASVLADMLSAQNAYLSKQHYLGSMTYPNYLTASTAYNWYRAAGGLQEPQP